MSFLQSWGVQVGYEILKSCFTAFSPRYGVGCAYVHGQQCDYCGQAVLHPTHLDQRRGHLAECLQEHERDMELSFAVARSKEKTCGICMETVLDKPKGEAR